MAEAAEDFQNQLDEIFLVMNKLKATADAQGDNILKPQTADLKNQLDQITLAMNQLQVKIDKQVQSMEQRNAASATLAVNDTAASLPTLYLIPMYDAAGTDKEGDYVVFEQRVRNATSLQRYSYPSICDEVLVKLRGRAAFVAKELHQRYEEFTNLDEFLAHLRSLFIKPAYKKKAFFAFMDRRQEEKETINLYYFEMLCLWQKAFDVKERKESLLIERFILGLQNIEIVEKLLLGKIDNCTGVLQEALRLEGVFEILRMNIERQHNNGQYTVDPQMLMLPKQSRHTASTEAETINRGACRGGDLRGNFHGHRNRLGRGHGHNSHDWGRGQNRSNRGGLFNQPRNSLSRVNDVDEDQCVICLGRGHWSYECPSKRRQGQLEQRQNYTNRSGGHRKRNNFYGGYSSSGDF